MISSVRALAALTFALSAVSSWAPSSVDAANPVFKLGKPTYFGSGCPTSKSIQVVPAADAQSVSVMFSSFSASTGDALRDRKACDLSVPVALLPGITIGIFKADYRGYAYVPDIPNVYAEFSSSYFFAGSAGPTYKKRWGPGTDEDVFVSNNLTATAIAWSPCKPSAVLRINMAITAAKPNALTAEDAQISIDSTDITVEKGIEFYLTYKKC